MPVPFPTEGARRLVRPARLPPAAPCGAAPGGPGVSPPARGFPPDVAAPGRLAGNEPRPTRRGVDRARHLYRQGLTKLDLPRGRDEDGGNRLEEVAEGEAANPASLVAKSASLLVDAGSAQNLHPAGAALVGRRWGDDPFWVKILRPYPSRVDDDALHGPGSSGSHFRRIHPSLQAKICCPQTDALRGPGRPRRGPGHSETAGTDARCRSPRGTAGAVASCRRGSPRSEPRRPRGDRLRA